MKFIITESQLERFQTAINSFINVKDYEGVCNVTLNYDDVMDRFVVNIFFDRKYFIGKSGGKTSSIHRRTVDDIGQKFLSFIGRRPFLYTHFEDC